MKALVAQELNRFGIEDLELAPPKAFEVKIKMAAVGVCHTELHVINGTIPFPMPVALGHEGAGVVEAIGEGVTHVQPGDHVVMASWPNCGRCFHCVRGEAFICQSQPIGGLMVDGTSRLSLRGKPVAALCSLGNIAEYVVCPAMHVVPIPRDIPLRAAALLGCGATCGVGAVLNTAKVRPGSNVAVFGCGGAGMATIQGARIAGALRIFAVDVSDDKLELAKRFGATHLVRAADAVDELLRQTGGIGVDYAFEVVGIPSVVETAYSVTRRGGMTVVLGVGKLTDNIQINALGLPMLGKTLVGSLFGSVNVQVDFPKLLGLYRAGKLDLDGMITRTYTLDQAVQAVEDMERGKNVRGVIVMD